MAGRRGSDHDPPARPPSSVDGALEEEEDDIDFSEDDFMPSVSDGFRPPAHSESRPDRASRDLPQRPPSTSKTADANLRRVATRNSTAKGPSIGQNAPPPAPLGHRASVSSTASFATTTAGDAPFSTGPSHPYGMYPQNIMPRPSSVATSSTERQPHRLVQPQQPAHPYAMYSQTGLDEEPESEPVQAPVPPIQTAIPVGFPGLNASYHRVIGPDGEEQDIVGPDGHTEQLPPYSRHPEEGPTKASLAAEPSASRVLPAPLPLVEADESATPATPASPLSVISFSAPTAPLIPPVAPARLPPQRPETQTGHVATTTSVSANTVPAEPSESSSASLLTIERDYSEKSELVEKDEPKSWKKKKLCGRIPMGVAVFVIVLSLAFVIALSAAVGTIVGRKQNQTKGHSNGDKLKNKPLPQVSGYSGLLFDATPIPTPPNLAPLPTGAYSLPLGIPQESNPGCLTQANQYSAWACKISFAPFTFTINSTAGRSLASLQGTPETDGSIAYGFQTPVITLEPMQLVLDLDYKAFGPAYHFSARYDKVVVLRNEELPQTSRVRHRQIDDKIQRQRFIVRPGENPWYCYWNQTYIEGYVYVQGNSSIGDSSYFGPPIPTLTGSASFSSTTGTPTAFALSPPTPVPSAQTTPTMFPQDGPTATSNVLRMPTYPRIVKIEERRIGNATPAYCQKMVMQEDGKVVPAPKTSNGPNRITLQEQDPTYEEYYAAQQTQAPPNGNSKRGVLDERVLPIHRRSDPSDACHCQWMFK